MRAVGTRLAALVAALAAGMAAAEPSPEAREAAERHWRLAQRYLDRGMARHAETEARVALQLDPAHPGARGFLERGPAAVVPAAAVPEAAAPPPASEPVDLFARARAAYRENRAADARRFAEQVLLNEPGHAAAIALLRALDEETYRPSPLESNAILQAEFERGLALYRREAWEAAAASFQKAIAISPTHDQSRAFFDRCRERAEAARLESSLAEGKAAAAAGRRAEAVAALRRVLAIRPAHPEATVLLESLGEGPEAAGRKRQAREHFNRGVAHYERGAWEEAAREWELVTGLDPSDQEAARLFQKARAKAAAARRAARQRIPAMHDEALTLYQQGKIEEARALYQRILALDAEDAKARRALERMGPGSAGP